MIFRRLIVSALFVGLFSGLLLSLAQITAVNPIIFAAEAYEVSEPEATAHTHHTDSHAHSHSHEAWSPEDGSERTFFTVLSNVLAGIGFAALMLSLMSQMQIHKGKHPYVYQGIIWGISGFLAFFVAPGIGLPPEIPGIEAAAVEFRQLWWVAAVIGVGAGLLIIGYAPLKYKVLGVLSILSPYLMPIPHHDGPAFLHPDPLAVEQLTALHQQFILTSGATNFVFWLVLGIFSAFVLSRFVYKDADTHEERYA